MKLRTKLLSGSLAIILGALGLSILTFTTAKSELEEQPFTQLTAVREAKAEEVERQVAGIYGQVEALSESVTLADAVEAFRLLPDDPSRAEVKAVGKY